MYARLPALRRHAPSRRGWERLGYRSTWAEPGGWELLPLAWRSISAAGGAMPAHRRDRVGSDKRSTGLVTIQPPDQNWRPCSGLI